MRINEDFFDGYDTNDSDELILPDYSKYGSNVGNYKWKLVVRIGDFKEPNENDIIGTDYENIDDWKDYYENEYKNVLDLLNDDNFLFEVSNFNYMFDHTEFVYYSNKKEFVIGFEQIDKCDPNSLRYFFEDVFVLITRTFDLCSDTIMAILYKDGTNKGAYFLRNEGNDNKIVARNLTNMFL